MRWTSLSWIPVMCVIASTAIASPISHDTGAPDGRQYGAAEWYILADDFMFDVDTIATHIASGLTIGETWIIMAGDGLSPTTLIDYGTLTQADVLGDGIYAIGEIALQAHAQYWLGHYGTSLTDCNGSVSVFNTTASNGTALALVTQHLSGFVGCQSDPLPGWLVPFNSAPHWARDNIPDTVTDFAFTVYGRTVPEPSFLALLSLACVCVTVLRRPWERLNINSRWRTFSGRHTGRIL